MNSFGRSLELFFVDGRPDGMLTAQVFNWTGLVIRVPRTQISDGLLRSEVNQTGVYVLLGEQDGDPLAYVGEAENLKTRIAQHVGGKTWWDSAILITTTGDLLNKAHVKYLESRLVEIATSVGVVHLENGTTPTRSSLSEAAQASMEGFIETLNIVLPAIRVDMFLEKKRSVSSSNRELADLTTNRFVLRTPKHGIEAFAVLEKGEMIVLSGSKARLSWAGSTNNKTHYFQLHEELIAKGILQAQGELAVFVEDYAFSSPSAAGAVINGRSTNGRTAWVTERTGISFADWELSSVERNLTT